MVQTKELLPIGTVLHLKGGSKRLMIFGILQADSNKPDQEYDYIGIPYPEGNMGIKSQYMFMHTDVEHIYFRGFEDVERQEFIFKLDKHRKGEPIK